MGSAWFDRTDLRAPAYGGYCKKEVAAHGAELVIGGDPELSHYICPHCRGTIGGSRVKEALQVFLVLAGFALVVGYLWIFF